MNPRTIRRTMEDRGFEPEEIEEAIDLWCEEQIDDQRDRVLTETEGD